MYDLVFEGGGAKGIALAGGLTALEDKGIGTRRLVGTSAGAITATNVAAGYSGAEIFAGSNRTTPEGKNIYTTFADPPKHFSDEAILQSGIGEILAKIKLPFVSAKTEGRLELALLRAMVELPGFRSVFSLLELGGLYAGDAFLAWMRASLDEGGRNLGAATFAEFHEHTKRDLSVVATDTSQRRLLVLNHRTAPKLPVAWGVRMSMSIPFYWNEVRWQAEWGPYMGDDITGVGVVDGGVVSNFPLYLLADSDSPEVQAVMGPAPSERLHTLGFYLDDTLDVPGVDIPPPPSHEHSRIVNRISALIDTMMSATDNVFIAAHNRSVCHLPVKGYGTTDFNLSKERVSALYEGGRTAAAAYLESAPEQKK